MIVDVDEHSGLPLLQTVSESISTTDTWNTLPSFVTTELSCWRSALTSATEPQLTQQEFWESQELYLDISWSNSLSAELIDGIHVLHHS